MKIEVESKAITEALKNLQFVSTNSVDTLIIEGVGKERLAITAFDNERCATAYLSAKVKNTDVFYIDPNIFTPLVKNRGTLTLEFSNTLTVSQEGSKYKVSDVPLKGGVRKTPAIPKSGISEKLSKRIKEALDEVLLKQVTTEDIFFGVGIKDSALVLGVADQFHAAISKLSLSKHELREMEGLTSISLPLSYATMLPKIPGNLSISVSDNNVIYFSDDFMVSLPAMATKPIDMPKLWDDLSPMLKGDTSIDSGSLKSFMDNIISAIDPLISVEFDVKSDYVTFKYATSKGMFTDGCDCKSLSKGSFKVDAANLADIIRKIKDKVKFSWNGYSMGLLKVSEGRRTGYFVNLRA